MSLSQAPGRRYAQAIVAGRSAETYDARMPTLSSLFIEVARTDTLRFVSVVFTVIISITLHELAHGWAALWQGDDTPRTSGHLTPNPVVHMGGFSLILLLTVGIAYGLMPVNPARFRSRYGRALVAAAGPAMNLLLAAIALTAAGLWMRQVGFWKDNPDLPTLASNSLQFLWYFGLTNFALLILNLLPLPPLDGSAILANFHRGYDRWIRSASNPAVFVFALVMILVLLSYSDLGIFDLARRACLAYLNLVSGLQLGVVERL